MAEVTPEEILEQLDEAWREYAVPGPPNANYPYADMRLHAFRSESEWLLVFQVIRFANAGMEFQNALYVFGNEVDEPGPQDEIEVVSEADEPLWDDRKELTLDKSEFTVVVGEKERRFKPSKRDYEKSQVPPTGKFEPPVELLRLLAVLAPKDLYLEPADLLETLERPKLEELIQLDDWHHPSILEDEVPSDSECFQRLARAIAENKKSAYSCPKAEQNTHWSNWPEY